MANWLARAQAIAEAQSTPAANERLATSEQSRELRELVAIVAADWPEAERAEALAVALADPDAALVGFRSLVAERRETVACPPNDDRMRTCGECANLSPGGRCLAAWHGESFGPGIALSRNYAPALDVPLRCARYSPGPNDADRRSGAERWPFLLEPSR